MASRRLFKSFSAAIKAHNAFSRPSPQSRAFSAAAYFSSTAFPNSFLFRPNSYIGVSGNGITSVTQAAALGQLLPHSFHFPSPRRFSAKVRGRLHVDSQFIPLLTRMEIIIVCLLQSSLYDVHWYRIS
ncbi:unnamed protein product [Microthlaspi erraticum]|uniref:Uncharacterized protein n=1 Tax=Microthlaspi erraticum TaxID=1685480 RepID=A0A6D2ICX9_9BRAS|nr:unnamed protein product [Microthlaspi erraticum]